MTYHIKSEYLSLWGDETTEDTIITGDELLRLSREWEKPVEELLEQLIPVPEKRWWIVDERETEWFQNPANCSTKEEAVRKARNEFDALSSHDQKLCKSFYVCLAAKDDDGCLDYNTAEEFEYIK